MKKLKAEKPRTISIRTKLLLPSNLIVIAICLILGFSSYYSFKTTMIQMGIEQAGTSASIAANTIDGSLLENLKPGDENTEEYLAAREILTKLKDDCNIAFLYTLYLDNGKIYYQIDTDTSENRCMIGDEYEYSYEEMEKVFQGEAMVQDYITSDVYGDLISSYMPIRNAEGTVVAVLGSDYDASSIVSQLNKTVLRIVIIAAACLAVSLIILGVIIHNLMRNLRKVNHKIYELVSSEGDLTQQLTVRSGDEMELIANNVNALLLYIREIMMHISKSSHHLADSSNEMVSNISGMSMSISDVSATMEEMSAAMEETTASLNHISSSLEAEHHSILAVSGRAGEGKEFSSQMKQHAKELIASSVDEQTDAKRQAGEMAELINEKIEKSKAVQEISMLTTNILNITDQTNLLALNASIEAARAGEAGRGFAVVANEISALASNSAQAAAQIKEVSAEVINAVNGLAKESEIMVQFMEETAMRGYDNLVSASETYQEDAEHMNGIMQEFSNASQQLLENMGEMKESISSINVAVEESAKGIANVTEVAVHITGEAMSIEEEANANLEIANVLNQEVGKFKLE